ncbi:hypothetical protein ACB094_12G090300 [Castanea mollissima]
MEHKSMLCGGPQLSNLIKASFSLNDVREFEIQFPSSSGTGSTLNFSLLTSNDKIIEVKKTPLLRPSFFYHFYHPMQISTHKRECQNTMKVVGQNIGSPGDSKFNSFP